MNARSSWASLLLRVAAIIMGLKSNKEILVKCGLPLEQILTNPCEDKQFICLYVQWECIKVIRAILMQNGLMLCMSCWIWGDLLHN